MKTATGKYGSLYVVSTPIGNLADISARARQTLAQADLVAAEDTRRSKVLLGALGISRPMVSMHEQNERASAAALITKLKQGSNVALISDAGTPLISDPGYRLVDAAHNERIRVIPVPGPCAAVTALSVSGIATDSFRFVGFLPSRSAQRKQALERLAGERSTLVFYESPRRVPAALEDFCTMLGGERLACYCRELTKRYETVVRMQLAGLRDFVRSDPDQSRGEVVIVVAGVPARDPLFTGTPDYKLLLEGMMEHMSLKQSARLLARATGRPRREFYTLGLEIGGRRHVTGDDR